MLYLSGFTAAVASVLEQPIVAVVAAVILVLSGILLQVLAPSNFVDLPELVRAVRTVALDGDRRADAPYLSESQARRLDDLEVEVKALWYSSLRQLTTPADRRHGRMAR